MKKEIRNVTKFLSAFREISGKTVMYSILIILVVTSLFPFFMMVSGSFKDNSELITLEQNLLPKQLNFRHYVDLAERFPFWRNFLNTVIFAGSKAFLAVLFCTTAGFAIAKYPFPGRSIVYLLVMLTLMIPFQSIIVPSYLILRRFRWLNTFYGLIVPGAVPAFGTFMMRQFIVTSFPDELLDSARIDGCSEFSLYWRIVVPVVAPSMWVLGLIILMRSWKNFIWPFIVVNKEEMFTIPIVIQAIAAGGVYEIWGQALAAATVGTIPLVVLFLLAQKYFISGLMSGFSKG
jgi:ABC-type glycerol-3-phosphate transport system permease component